MEAARGGATAIRASVGYVKDTGTSKGLGVFACRNIYADEVVEVCPVLVLKNPRFQLPEAIGSRVFSWGHLAGGLDVFCLALGWGSIYNHSNPANVRYMALGEENLLKFIAARDIDADEELTINYEGDRGEITSAKGDWFIDRDLHPI